MVKKILTIYKNIPTPAKASIWFTAMTVLQKGISFLVIPIYTRLLTPSEYGYYAIYLSWFSILSIFATLNLQAGVFNNGMMKWENDRERYISSMQGLSTLSTVLVFTVFFLGKNLFLNATGIDLPLLFALFIALFFTQSFRYWSAYQRYNFAYKKLVAVTIFQSLLIPTLGVFLIYLLPKKQYGIVFANVIGNAMGNSSESIENDITFELEKNIIIDTTYLSFFDDGYVVIDGFEELNGKLLMSSMFEQMSVDIYDDHGINVFSQEIPPSFNWNTSSIGLLYGDNYVEIKATEPDGTVMQKNFLLRCYTPDFNDNLMIDRDDDDGDGLINYIENYFGTDINNPDSDVDGLTDFQEIYDSSTDPLLWDTDENGISDGEEDNDGDGLDNITEYIIGSYIYAVDSDMDGLTDYDEYNLFHTSPLSADTDGDTLTDKEELDFGTSPLLYDTNDNGISDADEKYTTELDITEMGVYYDPNVYPTLSFNSDVKNTLSVTMETYDNDVLINGGMTGYIGCAYTFTSERQFDSAVMNKVLKLLLAGRIID